MEVTDFQKKIASWPPPKLATTTQKCSGEHLQEHGGKALRTKIRQGFTKVEYKQFKLQENKILSPFIVAGSNPIYMKKQVEDFIKAYKIAMQKRPDKYLFTIDKYFESSIGRALAFDQFVNNTNRLLKDMKIALDSFYETYTDADKNPNNWKNQRSTYEVFIIKKYAAIRNVTHRDDRNENIKRKLT